MTPALKFEMDEWQKLWTSCERELCEWNVLLTYGSSNAVQDLGCVADAAWHLPQWSLLRDCVSQLEGCIPPDLYYKHTLYKAMLLNHDPIQEELSTDLPLTRITRELDNAKEDLIREWKRLPDIVSQSHVSILQAASQVQEIYEGSTLANHGHITIQTNPHVQVSLQSNPVGDAKQVVKAWRNRSCALSDAFSFWTDIHHWRILHYGFSSKVLQRFDPVSSFFFRCFFFCLEMYMWGNESNTEPNVFQSSQNHTLLPLHSAAHSQLQIARAARKAGLLNVANDTLSRLFFLKPLVSLKVFDSPDCYNNKLK
ncbi:unnamed protein product [Gongylonema pulchrum]|uniref:FAT domain-containing protein n=1 Tax=Gongylonema pulchrum TaxID=637853 RepID=A0A183E2D5_9BILA|nr:unnamed protein product [Gongylonema pulchrum]